jgi:hypothetical protein
MTYETPTALRHLNSDHFQGLLGNACIFSQKPTLKAPVMSIGYHVEAPALARVIKRNLVASEVAFDLRHSERGRCWLQRNGSISWILDNFLYGKDK